VGGGSFRNASSNRAAIFFLCHGGDQVCVLDQLAAAKLQQPCRPSSLRSFSVIEEVVVSGVRESSADVS